MLARAASATLSCMQPLITAGELAAALDDRLPVLLDVRWRLGGPPARVDYLAAHLPGAVFVDLDAELSGPAGPLGRHPLPEPAALQVAMRRWGVCRSSPVVAYDDGTGSAGRAWWVLRWAGCAGVRVLDGGYQAWQAAGYPLAREVPIPTPGDVVVRPGSLPVLDAAGAAKLAASGVLLDARAAARYRGETEPVDAVAGHIPGAVSAPLADLLDSDGRLRAPAQLRKRLASLGVDGRRPVGAYCGSGVTAAAQVLALEVAGIEAALYPGSWSEWITDPARPVAIGGPA